MRLYAMIFSVLALAAIPAMQEAMAEPQAQTAQPESMKGNIFPTDAPIACTADKDCIDPRPPWPDSPPGGLRYGCLDDVKLCGYLLPPGQQKEEWQTK